LLAVRTGLISPPFGGSIGPYPSLVTLQEKQNDAGASLNVF